MTILGGRSAVVVGGGVAALVLSASAMAWACTPDEGIDYKPDSPLESQDRSPQPEAQPKPQPEPQPQPQPEVQVQAQPVAEPAPAPAAVATKAPARHRTAKVAPARRASTPAVAPDVPPASASPVPDAAPPAPATPIADAPSLPSMSRVSSELWSGFGTGSPVANRGPGLAVPAPAGQGTDHLMVGVGLLSAGLVVLGAGTAAAVVRRPRVRVSDRSR